MLPNPLPEYRLGKTCATSCAHSTCAIYRNIANSYCEICKRTLGFEGNYVTRYGNFFHAACVNVAPGGAS